MPSMGVPVQYEGNGIPIDRLLEPAGSKERIDLERLADDRLLHRRIVKKGDELRHADARERRLELQRLVDRLVHELFERRLAPGFERTRPEPAAEAFDARDADAEQFARVAVEHGDTGLGQDLADLRGFPRLEVVISQHGHYRDAHGAQLAHEHLRFFGQSVIGEITRDEQQIRRRATAAKSY